MRLYQVVGWAVAACWVAGCASTFQARHTKPSGFLKDYSQLKPGGRDRALLLYRKAELKPGDYTRILLEPVVVYVPADGKGLAKVPKEDRQRLADYLDASIRKHLTNDFEFVTEPGPGVMRVRVALTSAESSSVVRDTLSSVVPFGMAANALKVIATGTSLSVGGCSIEAEGLDSQSGERMWAAVDERVGSKYTGKLDKLNEWHAVQDSLDYWCQHVIDRMHEERDKQAKKAQ